MNVAIVGSRTYLNRASIEKVIRRLLENDPELVVVSGGAKGADTIAEQLARQLCKNPPLIFPADWQAHGKVAGFLRNKQIVANAQEIVVFWDGASHGSASTAQLGFKKGIPVHVFLAPEKRWLTQEQAIMMTMLS